jgi:hypothetical protein
MILRIVDRQRALGMIAPFAIDSIVGHDGAIVESSAGVFGKRTTRLVSWQSKVCKVFWPVPFVRVKEIHFFRQFGYETSTLAFVSAGKATDSWRASFGQRVGGGVSVFSSSKTQGTP